ncbi:MAG: ABC transporter substrate-binding protein [Acidobacteria bacterium]|nr:ABC transporter substrate-binding protein [Acidobacteriota bacterium]MBI3656364.1 ABC transporter substrate-binding protein [Acidobacteriota bacterium]
MKRTTVCPRYLCALFYLAGLLLIYGCSARLNEKSATPITTAISKDSSLTAAPATPSHKSDLNLCLSATEPQTLDPGNLTDPNGIASVYEITQHIFDRLVNIDAAGRIVPSLATSWEYLNPLTLQLYLRRDVLFHNGEPFNAGAVKFSLERLFQATIGRQKENRLHTVAGVDIVDKYTVKIRTTVPDGLLLRQLATLVFIFPPRYFRSVGKQTFGRQPIGTGPFRFTKWNADHDIVLTRNAGYWVPAVPKLDRVTFQFIPTADFKDHQWRNPLLNGQLDFIKQLPGMQTFKVQNNRETKLVKTRSTRYVVLMPNPFKPPFSDIRLRRAVALAIDRELLIRLVANGNGQPVALLSSDLEFGHNESLPAYPFDPDTAQALVTKAGYPSGLSARALLAPGTSPRLGPVLARFFKDINLDITVVAPDRRQLEKINLVKDYDLWVFIAHNPLRHSAFLLNQFLVERPSMAATNAYPVGFRQKFEQMVSTIDTVEQARLCHELERMAYETYFVCPLFQIVETYEVSKRLMYKPSPSGLVDLSEAYFQ